MSSDLPLLAGTGVGTRHEDDGLRYMPMPSEMTTFAAPIPPEPEVLEQSPETLELLQRLQSALDSWEQGQSLQISLTNASAVVLELLQQILGEGEVSIVVQSPESINIQETVLAGVWWVRTDKRQWLEVGEIPSVVLEQAFQQARWPHVTHLSEGVSNAGAVLVELLSAAAEPQSTDAPHVVNLSLLPFTPEDHAFLAEHLGQGSAVILSRGYGNCRIQSTATPQIWRVQYFNSTDQLILDTLEVTPMPLVACAAREDLEDSADRLREMREVL